MTEARKSDTVRLIWAAHFLVLVLQLVQYLGLHTCTLMRRRNSHMKQTSKTSMRDTVKDCACASMLCNTLIKARRKRGKQAEV